MGEREKDIAVAIEAYQCHDAVIPSPRLKKAYSSTAAHS